MHHGGDLRHGHQVTLVTARHADDHRNCGDPGKCDRNHAGQGQAARAGNGVTAMNTPALAPARRTRQAPAMTVSVCHRPSHGRGASGPSQQAAGRRCSGPMVRFAPVPAPSAATVVNLDGGQALANPGPLGAPQRVGSRIDARRNLIPVHCAPVRRNDLDKLADDPGLVAHRGNILSSGRGLPGPWHPRGQLQPPAPLRHHAGAVWRGQLYPATSRIFGGMAFRRGRRSCEHRRLVPFGSRSAGTARPEGPGGRAAGCVKDRSRSPHISAPPGLLPPCQERPGGVVKPRLA
jgi:hypothetical protein